jgi:hypothetical protein
MISAGSSGMTGKVLDCNLGPGTSFLNFFGGGPRIYINRRLINSSGLKTRIACAMADGLEESIRTTILRKVETRKEQCSGTHKAGADRLVDGYKVNSSIL